MKPRQGWLLRQDDRLVHLGTDSLGERPPRSEQKGRPPYSGVGSTNRLPMRVFATVSQHSTAQRRLSAFPVGNSCKIYERQQKIPQDQENILIVMSNAANDDSRSRAADNDGAVAAVSLTAQFPMRRSSQPIGFSGLARRSRDRTVPPTDRSPGW